MGGKNRDNNEERRLPPHDVAAEEAVIGAFLIDGDAVGRVRGVVEPQDFYGAWRRRVARAAFDLDAAGTAVDFVTLAGALGDHADEPELLRVIAEAATSLHVESYAAVVARKALQRRLLDAAGAVARLATDGADGMVEEALGLVASVARDGHERTRPLAEALSDYYDHVEAVHKAGEAPPGVPSGYDDLDHVTGGFQRGDLALLAARPGVGKTTLALCVAANAAEAGHRAALFSLEMSEEQVAERLVAAKAAIEGRRMRRGEMAVTEWPAFMGAIDALSPLPFAVCDAPSVTPAFLRSEVRRLQAGGGVDLVVVDYLQLMRPDGKGRGRYEDVTEISQALKAVARAERVPILALSQLSRGLESRSDKRPKLSDLRESGALEQDADVVMFLYREEMYDENTELHNVAEVIVAKNRKGPTGVAQLWFDAPRTRFRPLEIRRQPLEEVL